MISLAIFLVSTPSKIGSAFKNGITWISYMNIHLIRFALKKIHTLIQIYTIKFVLNMLFQSTLARTCLFWPRFYYIMLNKREGQSIWDIITNLVPPKGSKKATRPSNHIVCHNKNLYCHSFYQVRGAYAHLNQIRENDLHEAVSAATHLVYYDDPLHLAIPYVFFIKLLPEPPDSMLKLVLSFTLILLVYLYPIIRGIIFLWMRLLGAYIFSKKNNILVRNGRRRRRPKQQKEQPTIHVKFFATKCPNEDSFACDTDGLSFAVDNSSTAIICNVRTLFTGKLIPTKIMLETAEGTSASKTLVGIICLILTNDKNEHHRYNIPRCIYDPNSSINILGITALEKKSIIVQMLTTLSTTT